MNRLCLVSLATFLVACAVSPDRQSSDVDIPTHLSPGVVAIAEAESGVVDTDKHLNVRCKRIKLVGTHLHKRICYTTEEEEAQSRKTADEYYRRLGAGQR